MQPSFQSNLTDTQTNKLNPSDITHPSLLDKTNVTTYKIYITLKRIVIEVIMV